MQMAKKGLAKKGLNNRRRRKDEKKRRRTTTSLPTAIRKELAAVPEPTLADGDGGGDDIDDSKLLLADHYEYEEGEAEEESQKNRRYDRVDKLEYELPSDFEDEEIEEDDASGDDNFHNGLKEKVGHQVRTEHMDDINTEGSNDSDLNKFEDSLEDSDVESSPSMEEAADESQDDQDDTRHRKMLQEITGLSTNALEGSVEGKKRNVVVTETCPESEYNLGQKGSVATDFVSVQDLMDPLHGSTGVGSLKKNVQRLEKKPMLVSAPLPKFVQDKLERKAAYLNTKEEISKWQPIVKQNRESSTIRFDKKINVLKTSTGTIAMEFKPETELEKEITSLLQDKGVVDAQNKDGADILELNKVTVEDVKKRQGQLAKIRSLLFRNELKAKHLKKIKSKTYHRLLKRERLKAGVGEMPLDPEAAKEYLMKQEFKRAEERMTLKHKNTSKWAKRAVKRGLQKQDEGTRTAIAEQLQLNNMLTRKIHSINERSGSDESSSDDDDESEDDELTGSLEDGKSKNRILEKAKKKTLQVIGAEEEEVPTSGIFSLPFMVRGMEKRKKEVQDEAAAILEELDSKLKDDDLNVLSGDDSNSHSQGRLAFGELDKKASVAEFHKQSNADMDMPIDNDNDSDDNVENKKSENSPHNKDVSDKRMQLDPSTINLQCLFEDDAFTYQGLETSGTVVVDPPNNGWKDATGASKNSLHVSLQKSLSGNPTQNLGLSQTVETNLSSCKPWLYGISKDPASEENVLKKGDLTAAEKPNKKKIKKKNRSQNRQDQDSIHNVNIAGVSKRNETVVQNHNLVSEAGLSIIPDSEKQKAVKRVEIDDDDGGDSDCEDLENNQVGSQADLIRKAFAGDDVEIEFERAKEKAIQEELPASETVDSLPGWGQWTHVQQKKGLPAWILEKQEMERKEREEALRKRKDAKLKFVVISEKKDKKGEKYSTSSVPFPFDSRETYERNMRMPLGPEFNTAHAHFNMIQPSVIKRAGVIIDPIKFEQKVLESKNSTEESLRGKRKRNYKKMQKNSKKAKVA